MTNGERLKLFREAKGLDIKPFVELVVSKGQRVTYGYVRNLEKEIANSEHIGVHYLKAFARALEVREHVMATSIRDDEILKAPDRVLMEEVLEVFLLTPGAEVVIDVEIVRRVVRDHGGPRWVKDWPEFYQGLVDYRKAWDNMRS